MGDEDSGYFFASGENLIDCLSPLFPANFFVTVFPFLSVGFLALLYGDALYLTIGEVPLSESELAEASLKSLITFKPR